MSREPSYIGDGVYLSDDKYQLWLAANLHENRVIALEPDVFLALVKQGAQRLVDMGAVADLVAAHLERIAEELRHANHENDDDWTVEEDDDVIE